MGLFGDLDVAAAQEVSYLFDADTYKAIVSDFSVKPTKAGTMWGMNVSYTFLGGKYDGREFKEWQRMPHPADNPQMEPDKAAQATGYIKTRLLSLGVPENRINNITPEEIIGTEIYLSISKKMNKHSGEEQNRVAKIVVIKNEGTTDVPVSGGVFG